MPQISASYIIMAEEKDKKEKETDTGEEKKTAKKSAVIKDEKKKEEKAGEKDKKEEKKKEERANEEDLLKVKKDALGLEELPDDIKKKLEKKKAEREQDAKKNKGRKKRKKKTERKSVPVGKAFIKATYNNTIVTLTDPNGNVLSWASAGIAGFKGPKKATPYAAQIIARIATAKAREEYGLTEVSVFVKGVGTGRESAIRSLNSNGLMIKMIRDVTPIPHNGCRPRRPRRV